MDSTAPQDRWQEIIDTVLDSLADAVRKYLARLRQIPGYEDETFVDDEDVHVTAGRIFRALLLSIRAGEDLPELRDVAMDLGTRRARQGVPPESLMTAVQLDFGIIWGELMEACGPQDAVVLAAHVESTWRIIDRFAASTRTVYSDERDRLTRERLNVRHALVARLFASPTPAPAVVERAALGLGIQPDEEFGVAVADAPGLQESLHRFADDVAHPSFLAHHTADATVAFWPTRLYRRDAARLLAGNPCVSASAVHGLAAVPAAAAAGTALLLAMPCAPRSPVELWDGVPLLARTSLRTLGLDAARTLDDSLASCTAAERERIRETVLAYLDTGSVQRAAAALYCHRNTVLNRLGRFTALTGLDVTVPRHAAHVVIAWTDPEPR